MLGTIKNFQTISRHEAKLRQSPVVIECLTAVLNYIKSVLTDDSTQELVNLINTHINRKDVDTHYINLDLMGNQIIKTLRQAYIAIALYTNEEITEKQFLYFFRDIYDGVERHDDVRFVQIESEYEADGIIPDGDAFVKWLIDNPHIYTGTLPDDYDQYNCGLSISVTENLFEEFHNSRIDAHTNSLAEKLDELTTMCNTIPVYSVSPVSFQYSFYRLVDQAAFTSLMNIILARLAASGNPPTIDYTTYPDTLEEIISYGYTQELMIVTDFFTDMYDNLEKIGAIVIQYDIDSLEAKFYGGAATLVGYYELLEACGETDGRIYKKKYTDYYLNHLSYVLNDTMTLDYRNTLTELRGNVHTNYSKVNNVFTILNQNNFSIYLTLSVSKLIENKTLDIVNVVGLTKSIACLSLIPYLNGSLHRNKLVMSFDNYNPDFTVTLIDNMSDNDIRHISVVFVMSKTKMIVHVELNNNYAKYTFDNTNRMFDVFPFLLYTIPRVDNYLHGTNRITQLKLFGKALNDSDALAAIAGFAQ